jgi:hypothetical protein
MPGIRVIVNISFDEDNLPTEAEQKTIVGNIKEHVEHERDAEIPGFAKVTYVRAKSLDPDVVARPEEESAA